TLRQTERRNVHTPSTVPSLSHDGLPSKQLSSVVWSPPNSTRQSAAGFRPPPRQSGGQVWAAATRPIARTTAASAEARDTSTRASSAHGGNGHDLAANLAGHEDVRVDLEVHPPLLEQDFLVRLERASEAGHLRRPEWVQIVEHGAGLPRLGIAVQVGFGLVPEQLGVG